jgi:hypothetical protein
MVATVPTSMYSHSLLSHNNFSLVCSHQEVLRQNIFIVIIVGVVVYASLFRFFRQ